METHFENIKDVVLKELDSAEFFIFAAVAWITDYQIINKLIEKIEQGIRVELIINDDDRFEKRKIQFESFRKSGGDLYLYKNDAQEKSLMHHKFCIIDFTTTLTGSYNWSHSASTIHKENIVVARDDVKFSKQFAHEFKKIKKLSVLYAGKQTHYDISNYATVDSRHIEGEDSNQHVVFYISQGNKFGILNFQMTETIINNPPDKIFGFWREPVRTASYNVPDDIKKIFPFAKDEKGGELIVANGMTFYDFECLEPNLIKYIIQ